MGVHSTENANQVIIQNQGNTQGNTQGDTQGNQGGQGGGRFTRTAHQRLTRPLKMRRLGEALATMVKIAGEISLQVQDSRGYKMMLVPVDGQEFGMHYSVAAYAAIGKEDNTPVTSIYVYVLEGSNAKPGAENVMRNQVQYQRERTAMDAMDEETWKCVCAKVKEVIGDAKGDVGAYKYAGATIVPSDMDLKEEDNVHALIWLGTEAIWTNIEKAFPGNYEHWNLSTFFNKQSDKMAAMFTFNTEQQHDIIGKPVRSDITAHINIVDRHEQNPWGMFTNNQSFQHSNERKLGTVTGFVNAMYNPLPMQAQPQMTNRLATQVFVPHVNITDVLPGNEGMTPEIFWLNVFTYMIVSENYAWVDQFNNFGADSLHDIGQVGRRVPGIEDAIKTKGGSVSMQDIHEMARLYFTPESIVSIDCPATGPLTWLTDAIHASGGGSTDATMYIRATMDRLTNNAFGRIWDNMPGEKRMFFNKTKIHLTTYKGPNGDLLDGREIDSLAVLTLLGHQDMQTVNMHEMTYGDTTGIDPEMVLSRRLSLVRELTSNTVDVYGTAMQTVMTPQFRAAGVAALKDAGLAVDSTGLGSFVGNNFQNAMAYMNSFMGTSGAASMMYQGPGNGGMGWNMHGMSRWG